MPDLRGLLLEATGDVKDLPNVPAITRRGRILVWRRRGFRLAIAGVAAIALVSASSSIDIFQAEPLPPVEEAPQPRNIPQLERSRALDMGEYAATDFVAPFTLRIGSKGWFAGVVSPTWIYLTRKGLHVHVQRWDKVVTPRGARPLPAEVVAWFEHHPGLNVVRTQPADIGGLPATLIDVRPREAFTGKHPECPRTRCLILARIAEHEEVVDIALAETGRFYVVEAPGGPVFVYWSVATNQFERLKSVMDALVRSLRFHDADVL